MAVALIFDPRSQFCIWHTAEHMENKNTKFHPNPTIANKVIGLNTMAGRPGLPGVKCIGAAAATVAANGGLWTFGFKGL